MKYRKTNNTVYACQYHIVFCPKYRRKLLVGEVEARFKELAPAAAREVEAEIVEMEVMPDYVHMLVSAPPHVSPAQVVHRVKGVTSRLMRAEFPELKRRVPTLWTNSYFCSTVGGARLAVVQEYIQDQKTSGRANQKGKMG